MSWYKIVKRENTHLCYVCGRVYDNYYPWGEDGEMPSHGICECCGVEFGYEDCLSEGIKSYRKEWLTKGAPWFDPKMKPENWSLEAQLKNIPEEYR